MKTSVKQIVIWIVKPVMEDQPQALKTSYMTGGLSSEGQMFRTVGSCYF